jgi:ABC-type uncharacterized transport system permease subunit
MAQRVESAREETVRPAENQRTTRRTKAVDTTPSGMTVAQRIIWYIAAVLLILLAFRFVLALLGANPSNAFADFIYTTSHPFVAPFFSLFGYNLQYGVSRFEIYTLVAMAVYFVVAYLLARLFAIGEPEE